jgi:hypothetical protein
MDNKFKGYGVRVKLKTDESFAIAVETLSRMGIATKEFNLVQSCHILHKSGDYAILHFKELFRLDGKNSDISEEDLKRRNRIVKLLADWKILEIVDEAELEAGMILLHSIKIVKHSEKTMWNFEKKYTIGKNSENSNFTYNQ